MDNGLVVVNFSAPAPDGCLVVFHHGRNSTHDFTPRVNLQQLRPPKRPALVNLLKGLGDLIRIF